MVEERMKENWLLKLGYFSWQQTNYKMGSFRWKLNQKEKREKVKFSPQLVDGIEQSKVHKFASIRVKILSVEHTIDEK